MSEAAFIPESWPLIFDFFFTFYYSIYVGSGSTVPALEPELEPYLVMHSVSGSAKAKSYGSCGSGSGATTLADSNFTFEQLANRHHVHCEKNTFCRLFLKK
jgi:hypothetical protein